MYIRDCGYGRSKRCRKRVWPIIGICILTLGMGGVTTRVMAGQTADTEQMMLLENTTEMQGIPFGTPSEIIVSAENTVEIENLQAPTEAENIVAQVLEDDSQIIVIDPGHGGEDEGCARNGVDEKDINLQLGLALRDKLNQMGYEVMMTREGDEALALEERVKLANDSDADIYVSIHQNACDDSSVSGIETWYNVSTINGKNSKRLAQLIHSNLVEYTEGADRGLREDETLHVIREADMPSCLVETGFLSNKEDRDVLVDAECQSRIVDGIASGIDLYFNPKTMYLTFDDGPTPENTAKVLDILKENNVKATFFVIGENVRKNPDIARRIVEEGHTIGIHCNWHDYEQLYQDADSYLADFEQAYQTVYEVTGVEAKIFRFPGGSINAHNKNVYKEIIEEMTNRGYIYYDWNAGLEDTVSKAGPDQLIQNAVDSTLGRKRIIMLAHDTVDNTVLCLPELLEQFPEYRMEPLTADVEPIQF